jgi:hypothetical protein
VAEAVIRSVPGLGLDLGYALDGELRSSQVHRDAATLAADAHAKRSEMGAKGGGGVMVSRDALPDGQQLKQVI